MSTNADDPLLLAIDAASKMLRLEIDPAWLPAVRTNLDVSLRLGRLVDEFPLPDDHEPASIFRV